MSRFLRQIAVLVVLLAISACCLDLLFTTVFRRGRTVKAQWLYNTHQQHYDVAIVGGSRSWWNIDGLGIDTACGVRSINLANNHYTNLETLLSMEIFLANGNTVGHVLYQVDFDRLGADQEEFSSTVYDHLPFLYDSLTYAFLSSRSKEWVAYRYVPFYRYAKYNFRWGIEEVLMSGLGLRKSLFDSTGSHFLDRPFHGPAEFDPGDRDYRVSDDLLHLRDLCARHDIELDLFMAPYLDLRASPAIRSHIDSLLRSSGFAFHDMSDRLRDTGCYIDRKHLNREGGRRLTRIMIDELICPKQP
ncbi:MAG: hypothetical protein IPL52_02110 [Flavobacteriales bacterium]|nr:hypothetical protein [Flavobacteriales bacterium]